MNLWYSMRRIYLKLTRTTSGSWVTACPLTMLIGAIFPFLSIVFTSVSSPSSHIWATSNPAVTRPPCTIYKKDKTHFRWQRVNRFKYESTKVEEKGFKELAGLFRRSNIYDCTPWFSMSWIVFSMSVAADCYIKHMQVFIQYMQKNSCCLSFEDNGKWVDLWLVRWRYLREAWQLYISSFQETTIGHFMRDDGTEYWWKLNHFTR